MARMFYNRPFEWLSGRQCYAISLDSSDKSLDSSSKYLKIPYYITIATNYMRLPGVALCSVSASRELIVSFRKLGGQNVRWPLGATLASAVSVVLRLYADVCSLKVVPWVDVMPLQVEMDPRIISIFIKVSKKDCLLIDVGGVTFSRPRTSFLFVLGAREPRGLSPSFHLKKRDDFGPARRFCPPLYNTRWWW